MSGTGSSGLSLNPEYQSHKPAGGSVTDTGLSTQLIALPSAKSGCKCCKTHLSLLFLAFPTCQSTEASATAKEKPPLSWPLPCSCKGNGANGEAESSESLRQRALSGNRPHCKSWTEEMVPALLAAISPSQGIPAVFLVPGTAEAGPGQCSESSELPAFAFTTAATST